MNIFRFFQYAFFALYHATNSKNQYIQCFPKLYISNAGTRTNNDIFPNGLKVYTKRHVDETQI